MLGLTGLLENDPAEFARSLFEESNDGLFLFDPATLQIVDVNPAGQRQTKSTRRELLKKQVNNLFDSDPELLREFIEACHTTNLFQSRERLRLLRGRHAPLHVNITVSRLHTRPQTLGLLSVRDITSRRQMELALRESESQLKEAIAEKTSLMSELETDLSERKSRMRELMDDLDAIVWEADLPGRRFTFVSRQAERLLGFPVSDWLENPDFWEQLIHEDDREPPAAELVGLEDHAFEYRAVAADGEVVWLRDIVHVVKNERGLPIRLRGVTFDISREIATQRALRESESLFRSIFDQAAIGVAQMDSATGVIRRANRHYAEILASSSEALTGKTWMELTHPDDLADDLAYMRRLHAGEIRMFTVEKRLSREDGEFVWVRLTVSPMWSSGDAPTTHIAIVEDISEQKRTQEENLQLSLAIENAMQGISKLDGEGRFVMVKPEYAQMLGYTPEELTGQSWAMTVAAEDHQTALDAYHRMLKEGRAETESVAVRKDGSEFYKHILLVKSSDAHGQFDGHYCFMRDVTERKRAEQQLRLMDAQLAHVSRLSTMGEVVAGIAHEINQPLAAIANFSLACKNAAASEAPNSAALMNEWLTSIHSEAIRCGDIIRRQRAFAKKSDGDREPVDLERVIRDSIALVGTEIRQKSVAINYNMPPDTPPVFANPVEIRQVIVNLLRNACEAASDESSPVVDVRIDALPDRVRVTIEDNGPGVEESKQWKIFDAFFTTKQEGMGMGLAISRSIVESHRGNLRFEPGEPRGARFHLELPLNSNSA